MSYVPPHKRHSNVAVRPSPVRESGLPKYRMTHENAFAEDCIWKWLVVRSNETEGDIIRSVQFVPVSVEYAEWGTKKPLVLMSNNARKENNEVTETEVKSPWVSIAEKVEDDLLLAFERAKNRVQHGVPEAVKLKLVARLGKFLFKGRMGPPRMETECQKGEQVAEYKLTATKKWFHTNLPSSYVDKVENITLPNTEFQMRGKKDIYYVRLSHEDRPDEIFSCKCEKDDNRLKMQRVELNTVRHLVIDVSCIEKGLDLRLMIVSRKILSPSSDAEAQIMKELLDSALIDPNVKGGLNWPIGQPLSGNRYSVRDIWHTITTSYGDPTLRLKVREVERFGFMSGTDGATREVFLILKGMSADLQAEKVDKSLISDMLKVDLGTIWDNFLSCDPFLTS